MKHSILLVSLGYLLCLACNHVDKSAKSISSEHLQIERDGNIIDYTDSGMGETSLVFIHGWNINKTYWTNQVAFFSKKYRVATLDLPGFGKSGKIRKDWTVEEYAKDVSAILTKLDLKNIILIGHSMSGAIVLETALENPTRVIGVIGIDNFTNFGSVMSAQDQKDIADAYEALRTNYKQIATQYATQSLFAPSTDSSVINRVLSDFLNVDSSIAVKVLQTNDKYPIDEKLKGLGKPLYLINSNYHSTDTTGFKKYNVPFRLFYVGPTGHYPMIEDAESFNKQLEKAIIEIGKAGF